MAKSNPTVEPFWLLKAPKTNEYKSNGLLLEIKNLKNDYSQVNSSLRRLLMCPVSTGKK